MSSQSDNTTFHNSSLTRQDRNKINSHKSCVLWFTGLSGSGKSTLVFALEKELYAKGIRSYVLDGDNVRQGLNRDLGFSAGDRKENVRRIGEVSKLFIDAGLFVLAAFISPSEEDRTMVKQLFAPEDFVEVYVKCSVAECESRDPKGLYKRARLGEIPGFTGISSPYDIPVKPNLVIDTELLTIDQSISMLVQYLEKKITI